MAPTNEDINKTEDKIGRKLLADFVEWSKNYEVPISRNVFLDVDGDPCDLDELYSLDEIVEEVTTLLEDNDDLMKKGLIVPFAFDTILSQYCFFYTGESQYPTITVFFKHTDDDLSEIFDGSGIKRNLVISDSFQGFLDKIYMREK